MKLAELFVSLGFDVDEAKIKRVNESIKNLRRNLLETGAAFGAAIYGLDKFVSSTVQGSAALKNFNIQTGLSIEKLQKWQQAAQLSNLATSAESVTASVQNLQRAIAEIRLGRGNASPFTMLGIDVSGKDAFDVLNELRDRVSGLDESVASILLQDLGIDSSMLSVLRLSNQEFEKLGKNAFLSQKGRDAVLGVGKVILDLKLRLIALKDQAVAKLAPKLNELVTRFFDWLNKNHGKIISAMTGIVNIFTNFANMIARAIGLLSEFSEKIFGVENGIKFIGVAFGALILSMRPFLLTLFLIMGLLEDIAVWKAGGKSLFGDFYTSIDGLAKKFAPLKTALMSFKDTVSSAFDLDDKTKENLGLLSSVLGYLTKTVEGTALGAIIGYKMAGWKGAALGGGLGFGAQVLNDVVDVQKDLMKEYATKRIGGVNVSNELFERYKQASPSEQKSIANDIKVYVESTGDAKADGRTIGEEIIRAMHNQTQTVY